MYSRTTFYSPNFCCIFHQFTDQAITNTTCLDGELALQDDWLCRELALQGNVVQARAGQGFQVQGRTYINYSLQSEI